MTADDPTPPAIVHRPLPVSFELHRIRDLERARRDSRNQSESVQAALRETIMELYDLITDEDERVRARRLCAWMEIDAPQTHIKGGK